jgi:porin
MRRSIAPGLPVFFTSLYLLISPLPGSAQQQEPAFLPQETGQPISIPNETPLQETLPPPAGSNGLNPVEEFLYMEPAPVENAEAAPGFGGPWYSRPKLTGDWCGARSCLADHGITMDVYNTNFYQGIATGGRNGEYDFGGIVDYYFHLDSQKAGLWQGGFLDIHAMTRYGDDVNFASGLISVPNIAMLFPKPGEDITSVTSFKFTQALSENFIVYGGKINILDEYLLNFSSGRGIDRFMNTSLVFNPALARTVPYSFYGTGFAILKDKEPVFNFMVYDPVNRPTTVDVDEVFSDGVGLLAQISIPVKPCGLPGHQIIGGSWSSRSYSAVDRSSFVLVPGEGIQSAQKDGSWAVFYNFDQYLWVNPCNPKQGFGVFGQFGYSDGNPNPIQWSGSLGIGGNNPLRCRQNDTFGAGYFYLGLSDDFKDLLPTLRPMNDEHGFEVFYNFALTPWCHITADLQIVDPANDRFDTVIIPGIRGKIDF